MSDSRKREVPFDPELQEAVREAFASPPYDAVDWNALHGRIMAAAAPALERKRRPSGWDVLGGWSRRGVPLVATAAAAAMVLVFGGVFDALIGPATVAVHDVATVEDALASALPEPARSLVLSDSEQEALINAVVYLNGEEW